MRILVEPRNALAKQYKRFFEFENVDLELTDDALEAIADQAILRGTGARGLRAILEEVLLNTMYDLPGPRRHRALRHRRQGRPGEGEPDPRAPRQPSAAPPAPAAPRPDPPEVPGTLCPSPASSVAPDRGSSGRTSVDDVIGAVRPHRHLRRTGRAQGHQGCPHRQHRRRRGRRASRRHGRPTPSVTRCRASRRARPRGPPSAAPSAACSSGGPVARRPRPPRPSRPSGASASSCRTGRGGRRPGPRRRRGRPAPRGGAGRPGLDRRSTRSPMPAAPTSGPCPTRRGRRPSTSPSVAIDSARPHAKAARARAGELAAVAKAQAVRMRPTLAARRPRSWPRWPGSGPPTPRCGRRGARPRRLTVSAEATPRGLLGWRLGGQRRCAGPLCRLLRRRRAARARVRLAAHPSGTPVAWSGREARPPPSATSTAHQPRGHRRAGRGALPRAHGPPGPRPRRPPGRLPGDPRHRHQRQGVGGPHGHPPAPGPGPLGRHLLQPPPRADQRAHRRGTASPSATTSWARPSAPSPRSRSWPGVVPVVLRDPDRRGLRLVRRGGRRRGRGRGRDARVAGTPPTWPTPRWPCAPTWAATTPTVRRAGGSAIAEEKAGIVTPGVDRRAGPGRDRPRPPTRSSPPPGRRRDLAARRRTSAWPPTGWRWAVGWSTCAPPTPSTRRCTCRSTAPTRPSNAAVAVAAVEAFLGRGQDDEVVEEAFAELTLPGRFEVVGRNPTVVIDAAHNPDGAGAGRRHPRRGHDPARLGADGRRPARRPRPGRGAPGRPRGGRRRAAGGLRPRHRPGPCPPPEVAAAAERLGRGGRGGDRPGRRRCNRALAVATEDDLVLVAGSLYVAGPVRTALPRDGGLGVTPLGPDGPAGRPHPAAGPTTRAGAGRGASSSAATDPPSTGSGPAP